jgi:hypothetical protein
MTIHRWFGDPVFLAAFNDWQQEVATTARARLLAGVEDALNTVLSAVRDGNATIAWRLLQGQGFTTGHAVGPTDPAEIIRRRGLRRVHEQTVARKEYNQIIGDELATMDEVAPSLAVLGLVSPIPPPPSAILDRPKPQVKRPRLRKIKKSRKPH